MAESVQDQIKAEKISKFDQLNAEKKTRSSSVDWQKRYELAKDVFPSLTRLDWTKIWNQDPKILGDMVNDIVAASEASPRRPGKRAAVSAEKTRDNLVRLSGADYSLDEFVDTFRNLTIGKSVRSIAAKTGLDRNHVYRLQQGKATPDTYSMEVIAKAYGKGADYFLEYRLYYISNMILSHLENIPEAGVHFYRKLRKIGIHG